MKKDSPSGAVPRRSSYTLRRVGLFPCDAFHYLFPMGLPDGDYAPVTLYYAGYTKWSRGVKCLREHSSRASVEYVSSGTFRYSDAEGRDFQVKEGELMLLRPDLSTTLSCESERAVKYVFSFQGHMLSMLLEYLQLTQNPHFHPRDPERWRRNCDEGEKICTDYSPGQMIRTAAFSYSLLLELAEERECGEIPDFLQRTLDFIQMRLTGKLTLEELCAVAGVSPSTLFREFKRHFQTTPLGFARDRKMLLAQEMLKQGNCSVKEVAAYLNYPSPQYFSSEFKKRYGTAPRAFAVTKAVKQN